MNIDNQFLLKLEKIATKIWMLEAGLDKDNQYEDILRRALFRARCEINTTEHLAKVQLGMREI